jgi:hypothetical protein
MLGIVVETVIPVDQAVGRCRSGGKDGGVSVNNDLCKGEGLVWFGNVSQSVGGG